MVTTVGWTVQWEGEPPDRVRRRVEEFFLACRNISDVHIAHLEAVHFPLVLNAIGASDSRTTINAISISGLYLPTDDRGLTEADLQLYLLSFPSLTTLSIDFFVDPPSLASSELLNLRKLKFRTLPTADDSPTPYLSLLRSINPHTLKEFKTRLRHLKISSHIEPHAPCEDFADLAALRQILSILPPTLRSLKLPFAITPETTPIQQLVTDSPCKRLVLLRCWNSAANERFYLKRKDETADWREF
ncbi:hypothetical protein JCM5296_007079 [Sporobolomyces johnsonii]